MLHYLSGRLVSQGSIINNQIFIESNGRFFIDLQNDEKRIFQKTITL